MHPESFVQPAAVKAIALGVNVTHLTDEAARVLAPDVEYRLREVIQDALKFARHSKRTKLTTQDVNNALRLRNVEPLYGFLGNNDPAKFVRATGHPDVYFVRDSTVPLEQITCAPLPKAPNQTTVMPHWLFIDGVQPHTEENAAVERPPPPPKRQRLATAGAGQGAAAQGPGQAADAAAGRKRDATAASQQQRGAAGAAAAAVPGATTAAAGALGPDGATGGSAAAPGAPGQGPVAVQMPVQHILSDEMQRLLEQIKQVLGPASLPLPQAPPPAAADGGLWGVVEEAPSGAGGAALSGPSALELTPMQRAVLTTMQSDPGMQQLLPYLTKHIVDEVAQGLRQLPRLHMVLQIMQALLLNPHVQLEPYLHQLMPPLLTCCLAKSLGSTPTSDHWALRDAAAALVARLCNRFGEPFYSLRVKVSKQLIRAFLDGAKPLTSHYGAVAALAALGHTTVRLLLLPQLEPYVAKLQPALGARREGVRQYDATRVYGALLAAAGAAMYDKLLGVAADGLLPVHLFRGGRTRREPRSGDAAATAAATAPPAPPPNPELDALWESVRNPSLQSLYEDLVARPDIPDSVQKITNLRAIASNPSHDSAKAAQALLHQLAKRGVGVTPVGPASPPGNGVGTAGGPPLANGGGPSASATANGGGPLGQRRPGGPGKSAAARPAADVEMTDATTTTTKATKAAPGGGKDADAGRRSPREVLADSWREDADLGEVVWALTEVFGPAFLARLPQPPSLTSLTL